MPRASGSPSWKKHSIPTTQIPFFGPTKRLHSPYWEPCCPKVAVKSRDRDDLGESFSMRRVMPHDQSHSTNCSASSTRSYFSSLRSTREGGWNLTVGRQPGRLSVITN